MRGLRVLYFISVQQEFMIKSHDNWKGVGRYFFMAFSPAEVRFAHRYSPHKLYPSSLHTAVMGCLPRVFVHIMTSTTILRPCYLSNFDNLLLAYWNVCGLFLCRITESPDSPAPGFKPYSMHGFNHSFVKVLYSFKFSNLVTVSLSSIFFFRTFGSLKSPPVLLRLSRQYGGSVMRISARSNGAFPNFALAYVAATRESPDMTMLLLSAAFVLPIAGAFFVFVIERAFRL